jgi:hypothetical protein
VDVPDVRYARSGDVAIAHALTIAETERFVARLALGSSSRRVASTS